MRLVLLLKSLLWSLDKDCKPLYIIYIHISIGNPNLLFLTYLPTLATVETSNYFLFPLLNSFL